MLDSAKAGSVDHTRPVRKQQQYLSKYQEFNSDSRWSIYYGEKWSRALAFPPFLRQHDFQVYLIFEIRIENLVALFMYFIYFLVFMDDPINFRIPPITFHYPIIL